MMEELKYKIVSCAHLRFHNGGIKWPNLDSIASDCGISRKTLNQHFNRDQLIDEVIDNRIATYHQSLLKIEKERLGTMEELTRILRFTETLSSDFSDIFLRDLRKHYHKNWLMVDNFITGSLRSFLWRT
jgi:AcrR family transcriptional regulator